MQTVNISEFRSNLLNYLQKARAGEELAVTSHGEVLATILPPPDKKIKAKETLESLSKTAVIGDVVSPVNEIWKSTQ